MNAQEARIIVLEAALGQAHSKISFLHGCLTNKDMYKYAYPGDTTHFLGIIDNLLPDRPTGCFHSVRQPDCSACVKQQEHNTKLHEAKALLSNTQPIQQ